MNNYSNNLIYGNSKLERIVSVEPNETGSMTIFRELESGEVVSEIQDARYWLITNRSISPSKEYKMEGNQYFKYFHEFKTLADKHEVTGKLYKKRIDFYHIYDLKESNLIIEGMTYFKGMTPADVSVLSFDIESDGLNKTKDSEIYIITNTFRRNGVVTRKGFFLDDYNDDMNAMLTAWCQWVCEMNPSLMIGHNIYGYDLGYFQHVANLCGAKLKLGRDNSELRFNEKQSKFRKDGSQEYEYNKAYIYGREIVDTFFLSMKYDVARNFPSYGLKPIIKHLGLEKEGRSFVAAGNMKAIYYNRHKDPEMWAKAKQYAEEDSDDALKLYDLMIPSFFYLTQSVSKSFQEINTGATGSQVNNIMVRAYLQDGHSIAQANEAEKYEGAISFGIPGIYKNGFKWDVASLYPSIIREFKVYNKQKDPKAYFLNLVETFTLERLKNKKLAKETGNNYYTDLEQSQKIFINSAYGFLGASGLNYNDPPGAALVTAKGREMLDIASKFSTGYSIDYWKNKVTQEISDEI